MGGTSTPPAPLGGAAGGLYKIFETLGGLFISVFFGRARAELAKFDTARVICGGAVCFGFCGSVIGLLVSSPDPSAAFFSVSQSPLTRGFNGLLVGAIAGGVLAMFLVFIERS